MLARLTLALLLAASLPGCLVYEYEHEIWLRTDGSGTVYFTGRPALWAAFKGLGRVEDGGKAVTRESARELFERSGLRVRRVRVTERGGHSYVFVSADFADVNRLGGTPAFPDLRLSLTREGERLRLAGRWEPPPGVPELPPAEREGLLAVRFHLPSRVYEHHNAVEGVERGNIVAWRQTVEEGARGRALEVGALLDRRSILLSTVGLFAGAIVAALVLLAAVLALVVRRGRRAGSETPAA